MYVYVAHYSMALVNACLMTLVPLFRWLRSSEEEEDFQTELSGGRLVEASMEFQATGLSVSDRSGELDTDADLFESAVSAGSPR